MIGVLVRKELRLLAATSAVAVVLDFLLVGLGLSAVMTLGRLQALAGAPQGGDRFALFAVLSFGLASMFLSLTGPTALLERTTGILDNQLGLVASPRPLLVAKAVVLAGLAWASLAFWTGVGVAWAAATGQEFVPAGAWGRSLPVVAVLYPAAVALLSLCHVFVGYMAPKLAPVANIGLFAVTFVLFSNLVNLSGSLSAWSRWDLAATTGAVLAVVAGIVWLMGVVSKERMADS